MLTRESRRNRSAGNTGKGALKRVLVGFVLMLSGISLFIPSARWLIAEINAEMAQSALKRWGEGEDELTAESFALVEAQALQSIRLHPGDSGEHWDRLGRVYDWANWEEPVIPRQVMPALPNPSTILAQPLGITVLDEPKSTRLRAVAVYEKAIALRPLWPYTRMRLAAARLKAGVTDDETNLMIQQAFALGPWRRSINRGLTQLGFLAWDDLDARTRFVVLENARRTASFGHEDVEWLRNIAERTGHDSLIDAFVLQ